MTYLITGGANGIGKAFVKKCMAEQQPIVVFDRDQEKGLALASQSKKIHFIHGDVRDLQALKQACNTIVKQFGKLEAVIINAGIYCHTSLLDLSAQDWEELLAVNLTGALLTLQAALPHFMHQKSGRIVMISSDQALRPKPKGAAYAATKAALIALAKGVALDHANDGIRINVVCPGTIKTAMTEKIVTQIAKEQHKQHAQIWQMMQAENPQKRLGKAEDVAELIYFLCSDKASFINATVIPIDGGVSSIFKL